MFRLLGIFIDECPNTFGKILPAHKLQERIGRTEAVDGISKTGQHVYSCPKNRVTQQEYWEKSLRYFLFPAFQIK